MRGMYQREQTEEEKREKVFFLFFSFSFFLIPLTVFFLLSIAKYSNYIRISSDSDKC